MAYVVSKFYMTKGRQRRIITSNRFYISLLCCMLFFLNLVLVADDANKAAIAIRKNKIQFLKQFYKPSDALDSYLKSIQQEINTLLSNKDYCPLGAYETGYYCDNDGTYQPFVRYLPATYKKGVALPLVVFLHGYWDMNIINWSLFDDDLKMFSEINNVIIAMPFGRSNTDFQGIGEQDVLNVVDVMRKRYTINGKKIFLMGHSMGGLGTWGIIEHTPNVWAGAIIVSGRGDYYFWHKLRKKDVPLYKQTLIDRDFIPESSTVLKNMPLLVYHGKRDDVVSIKEGRFIVERVKKYNSTIKFIEFEFGGHNVMGDALFNKETTRFIRKTQRKDDAVYPAAPLVKKVGAIKDLFLEPFIFVDCDYDYRLRKYSNLFKFNVYAWFRYTKALPRIATERELTAEQKKKYHLFLFGTPERSELVREALKTSYIKTTPKSIEIEGNSVARNNIGIFARFKSPFNMTKSVVVNWGIPWGGYCHGNHIYDSLPGYIIYKDEVEENDAEHGNKAIVAGFYKEKK